MRSENEGLEEEIFEGMDGLVRERAFPCMNCVCLVF
jgi:hypothetical protein